MLHRFTLPYFKFRGIFFLVFFILVLFPSGVQAAGNSIEVTPSIRQIDLAEDKPVYSIVYSNNTADLVELNFTPQDFADLEDGWKINFLEQKDASQYQYSLSSWIELNKKSMVLGPHEKGTLEVTVLADRLPLGGHYASILAQISSQEGQNKQISLKGSVSSLLFVRANTGKETLSAEIFSLTPIQNFYGFPVEFQLKMRNTGNTHFSPFGELRITDPWGQKVSQAILNDNSFIILPETIRSFELKTSPKMAFLWPGIYQAQLFYHLGEDQTVHDFSIHFFSIGNLLPVILGILMVFVLVMQLFNKRNTRRKHSA